MIKKTLPTWQSIAICTILFLSDCQSHFDLVKANRKQYSINNNLAADSSIIKYYLPYKQKMEAEMNAVIGHTDSSLYKGKGTESTLGNFFSDACLTEAIKIDPTINFAMSSTNGGLRNSLPKGNITRANIFELMPFENELWVLKLKGSDVAILLNFIAKSGGQPLAGIKLVIKDGKATDVYINGKPFNPATTYNVLTSDYIAGGGDGSIGLAHPIEKKVLNLKVRDALLNYIKTQTAQGKNITANLNGRVTKN